MNPVCAKRDVERFRSLVTERLGLAFDDTRLGMLAESLRRRVEANGGAGEPYLRLFAEERNSAEELRQLARDLTVTETYFYRNAEQIRAFVEVALPQHFAACAGIRQVRVLSAGCASGDEPFSLAMAIREFGSEAAERVSITAVDVNPAMLEKARRAHYTDWSLRELPDVLRARWFSANGTGFALDESLRRAVVFEERNLAPPDPELWRARSWDVVFCRNVLMYFDPVLALALVERIAGALTEGGHLFLGHAETLRGLSNDFHLCHTHGTFYYRLKGGGPEPRLSAPAVPAARQTARPEPPQVDDAATWVEAVRRAAARIEALADASRALARKPAAQQSRRAPDLTLALELLRRERFDQVLAQLDALPAEQAHEAEVLLLRAVSAAHSGALAHAEMSCRELLLRDEFNAGAHYILALCREGLGDQDGAMEADHVALYLDSGFAMARLHLGLVARRRGEPDTARRELARALTSLQQEDASRLLLFGGGFGRDALVALCRAELAKCGGHG
ncbi:MAG: methyltransferase domain-containing protein [Betaproteobacteria bacterium]|nr:methyltransferase domain-containing protein [Betaproteobacteria bacterium]